jgi:hypothetical protein
VRYFLPTVCFLILSESSGFSQVEVGLHAGLVKPQFYYKESAFQKLLYADDSSYNYSTSFEDRTGQQASFFVKTKKNSWSFTGLFFYQNRQTTSSEQYNYYSANGSYDPFFSFADTIIDTRTVTAQMHGAYVAVLPGVEIKIGEGRLFFDAGFYCGYIFRSSTTSSGSNQVSEDGNQTTETWTDRLTEQALKGPDAGFIGGLGFNYPIVSSLCLQAEVRGSRGIADLGTSDFGYYGVGKINSVNLGFNFGVLWRFE